jgi:hypothetical protein
LSKSESLEDDESSIKERAHLLNAICGIPNQRGCEASNSGGEWERRHTLWGAAERRRRVRFEVAPTIAVEASMLLESAGEAAERRKFKSGGKRWRRPKYF